MARCSFCEERSGVVLAAVIGGDNKEIVDACGECVSRFNLLTDLKAEDLPYPKGGGDLQPEVTGRGGAGDDLLLVAFAVNELGARVTGINPGN